MKFDVHRVIAKLGEIEILTHMLPYEARFVARHG
jgi:hypothetical protein